MQFIYDKNRVGEVLILTVLTLLLFVWSVWEGLGLNLTLLSLVLPVTFTLGVGYFWFLIPSGVVASIPSLLIYGFGIYTLCSTVNIFTVSAIKTIPLVRSARGIGFVLSLFTYFLLMDTVLSLRWDLWKYTTATFLVSFPLFFQGFWSVNFEKYFSKLLFIYSLLASLLIVQISIILFFWPVKIVVGSLFLTVFFYILLGLGQAKLEDRLFSSTVREYLTVGIVVFVSMFLATSWVDW